MLTDRSKLKDQLEDAMVSGRDPAKIHLAIAQLDKDTLEAETACRGFSQKQKDVRKAEQVASRGALLERHAVETQQVAELGKKMRTLTDEFSSLASEAEKVIRQHGRTVDELESLGERRLARVCGVARKHRRPSGTLDGDKLLTIRQAGLRAAEPDPGTKPGELGESAAFTPPKWPVW